MASKFVHLHCHSDSSLLDGGTTVDRLVRRAIDLEMPALALTDHGVMYGAWEFQEKARKQGLKPIIGMEAYVSPGHRTDRETRTRMGKPYYHLVLLARDRVGYENLVKLSSRGFTEGFYYHPRVDRALLEEHSEGIIVSSACLAGEVAQNLMAGDDESAAEAAAWYANVFKDRYYLEAQAHHSDGQAELNAGIFRLSERLGLPVVATNDCHFLTPDDHAAHDTLVCIGMQKDKADPNRLTYDDGLYFKAAEEMAGFFPGREQVLENTLAVADSVDVSFDKKYHVPAFPLVDDERSGLLKRSDESGTSEKAQSFSFLSDPDLTPEEREQRLLEIQKLRELSYAGARDRFESLTPEIEERLDYELDVISSTGYSGYHLIVQDFIRWAREQDIAVGPGRGSAAGSLVCYCLGITNLDPLEHKLLFERYLNPERVSMPDIDVDFCYERRGEVIDYVREKYGQDAVCQIITFGTLKSRAAVKDVGRTLGFTPGEMDKLAKMIPNAANYSLTIEEAIEKVPEVRDLYQSEERYRELLDTASRLEGLRRHASVHAAGVVIAPGPVDDYVPVAVQGGSLDAGGAVVSQYDMNCLERAGMLKMDFLGLKTLTVIRHAVEMVNGAHPELNLHEDDIPLDDPEMYQMIRDGGTAGVFQLESSLAMDKLQAMRADSFDDLVATNALIRPGPLDSGMTDAYIRRKRGDEDVTFPHPLLSEVLKDTQGIIVYQEQIMEAARVMAGYRLGEADVLRKAVGKKDAALIQKELASFVKRCVEMGSCSKEKAEEISSLIETFGRYGFNRSHSAAYSLLGVQTAWLKTHYPNQFMAALLSSVLDKTDDVVKYLNACQDMGIEVLPPSVNESGWKFSVVEGPSGTQAIRFGLGAIRGVGTGIIQTVLDARREGPFEDIFDFVRRSASQGLNRRVLDALIFAGAMDGMGGNRAQMLAVADGAIRGAAADRRDREAGQLALFAGDSPEDDKTSSGRTMPIPDVPELPDKEKLVREKEALGLYVSGHPLERVAEAAKALSSDSAIDLREFKEGPIRIAGIVSQITTANSRRDGREYAKIIVEDLTGSMSAIVFADQWARFRYVLEQDGLVVLEGTFSERDRDGDRQPDLRVDQATPLLQAMAAGDVQIVTHLDQAIQADGQALETSRLLMEEHAGVSPVLIELERDGEVLVRTGRSSVKPSPELLEQLRSVLGQERVRVVSREDASRMLQSRKAGKPSSPSSSRGGQSSSSSKPRRRHPSRSR